MKPRIRLLAVVVCLRFLAAAQQPAMSVSSAGLNINPAATDGFNVSGSFSGITLAGAQALVFSVGQFGAAIPLNAFVQQPGTNVYQYNDATGLSPYWVSSLTIDLDSNLFTATASGIVLTGLTNPFPVQVGTDAASACGMVTVQGVSPGQYQLNPTSAGSQPCAIPAPPVADPPAVPVGATARITVTITASGLDAQSAMLYLADDNAQPLGDPLCTFSDNGDGTLSCAASFNEANTGAIPLIVQATVAGQPVAAPGFSIQAVAPLTDADMQQLSYVHNIMLTAGDQAYSQYGDSVQARIQVLSALRQYMQPAPGLTGQPVVLSLDGSEIGVICDSGLPAIYVMGDPDDADLSGAAAPAVHRPRPAMIAAKRQRAVAPMGETANRARPAARAPQQCGDFQRDIVGGDEVLVWDPGSLFFGQGDAAPYIGSILQNSKCPDFQVKTISGAAATVASISQFLNYATIIMNTHGGVDPNNHFLIVSGEPSGYNKDYWGDPGKSIPLGTSCFRLLPLLPEANPPRCYVSIYPSYLGWQVASNSIVYGGFCNGFTGGAAGTFAPYGPYSAPKILNSPWPGIFAPIPTNAYIGYNSVISAGENFMTGRSVFNSLVNSYANTFEAVDDSGDPKLDLSQNGRNLAYVGNPRLLPTNMTPPVAGALELGAFLDGAASCGLKGDNYMNVKWTNPAAAGHLTSIGNTVNGSQDNFTNLATCNEAISGCNPQSLATGPPPILPSDLALAAYKPDPSLAGNFDNIIADFYPDPANPEAARACAQIAGDGLFVADQMAAVWDANIPSQIPPLTEIVPAQKVTQTYTVPLHDPGGYVSMGATANVTVTPVGQGAWTVKVTAGAANPNYPKAPGYQGRAVIDLLAINPGAPGKAMVKVDGQVSNADVCQPVTLPASPPVTVTACTSADGVVVVTDSQGHTVESGSLHLGDKNALGSSFSVAADSSCSGFAQPTAQCRSPQPVGIGVSLTESIANAPKPATFSVTLNIQFMN
jgi:hypothetical protein